MLQLNYGFRLWKTIKTLLISLLVDFCARFNHKKLLSKLLDTLQVTAWHPMIFLMDTLFQFFSFNQSSYALPNFKLSLVQTFGWKFKGRILPRKIYFGNFYRQNKLSTINTFLPWGHEFESRFQQKDYMSFLHANFSIYKPDPQLIKICHWNFELYKVPSIGDKL